MATQVIYNEPVPEGDFYINNQKVTMPDFSITVTSPTLSFMFQATANGDSISSVEVDYKYGNESAWIASFNLNYVDTNKWVGSYTLDKFGSWYFRGYITTKTNQQYQKMSIMALNTEGGDVDIDLDGSGGNGTQVQMYIPAITLGIIGLVLVVFGVVIKTKAKRR